MIRSITAASAVALAASLAACGGALPAANTRATTSNSSSSPSSTSPEPTAESSQSPVIEKRTVTVKKKIAFATKTVHDPSLTKGTRKVRTKGAAGVKTLTYEVTLTDGVETGRKLLRQVMTKRPVT